MTAKTREASCLTFAMKDGKKHFARLSIVPTRNSGRKKAPSRIVQHTMAMSIGDEFEIEHIRALQILYEAQKCDLEFSLVQKILSQVLNKLSEALNRFEIPSDCDDEEREFCSTYSQSIELRLKKWSDELKLLPQLAKDSSLF